MRQAEEGSAVREAQGALVYQRERWRNAWCGSRRSGCLTFWKKAGYRASASTGSGKMTRVGDYADTCESPWIWFNCDEGGCLECFFNYMRPAPHWPACGPFLLRRVHVKTRAAWQPVCLRAMGQSSPLPLRSPYNRRSAICQCRSRCRRIVTSRRRGKGSD